MVDKNNRGSRNPNRGCYVDAALVILKNRGHGSGYHGHINTDTLAELTKIPGIGRVIAQRIIDGRPYTDITELLDIQGITPQRFAVIEDDIEL